MIPKKPAPDVIRGGYRFSEKIMLPTKGERIRGITALHFHRDRVPG
jgi:hypothetical protein